MTTIDPSMFPDEVLFCFYRGQHSHESFEEIERAPGLAAPIAVSRATRRGSTYVNESGVEVTWPATLVVFSLEGQALMSGDAIQFTRWEVLSLGLPTYFSGV